MNKPEAQFDNSDVLSPLAAMQEISERVIDEIANRLMIHPSLIAESKTGTQIIDIPVGRFKPSILRNSSESVKRRLTLKQADAPAIQTIREEFHVAAVTAYQNKSPDVFYIRGMCQAFLNNANIAIGDNTVAYELGRLENPNDEHAMRRAYHNAFSNTMRFHPLYVAYLYGVSGDKDREALIFNEVVEHYGWCTQNKNRLVCG